MAPFKSWITLFRVSNLPTVWSNVLTAFILSATGFSWHTLLITVISLSLIYCGGMALNDIRDHSIDLQQRPSRPLPSGKISPRAASSITILLFVFGLGGLLLLPHGSAAIASGAALVGLVILYDWYHKENPFSVLLMAGCRLMLFLVVGWGAAGSPNVEQLSIGMIQFFYVIMISLAARYENRNPGVFSFPLIPLMLAGICLVDGIYLSFAYSAVWLLSGAGWAALTLVGQKFVRGD